MAPASWVAVSSQEFADAALADGHGLIVKAGTVVVGGSARVVALGDAHVVAQDSAVVWLFADATAQAFDDASIVNGPTPSAGPTRAPRNMQPPPACSCEDGARAALDSLVGAVCHLCGGRWVTRRGTVLFHRCPRWRGAPSRPVMRSPTRRPVFADTRMLDALAAAVDPDTLLRPLDPE